MCRGVTGGRASSGRAPHRRTLAPVCRTRLSGKRMRGVWASRPYEQILLREMRMNWLSRSRPLVIVAAAVLGAFACGGGGGGGGGSSQNKGTIAIGVDLPESGSEASNGVPTLNGVKFAVDQQKSIKGFNLTVVNFDDAVNGVHDPQKGAQNINQMLANADVLAMVGPFNSNVARAEIPITNQAGLVQVSPANTNECLTRDYDYCDRRRRRCGPPANRTTTSA